MKKIILILTTVLLLQGCSFSDKKNYDQKVAQYESFYKTILDNDSFSNKSPFFEVQAKMDKADEVYVYEIIVDDARIAMYDVKIMVVEDQKDYNEEEKMMPSAGIFDDQVYNVIPNQSRIGKGYMSGFQLLGETSSDKVNLQIIVTFNDYRKLNTYREFLEFDLEYPEKDNKEDKEDIEDIDETEVSKDEEVKEEIIEDEDAEDEVTEDIDSEIETETETEVESDKEE